MENQRKKYTYDFFVVGFLIAFIFLRWFVLSEQNMLISFFNYMGLVGSVSSLYVNVYADCKTYKKINFVTGLFAVLLIIMGVIAFLILGEIIVPNTKANDVISLFALLFTLPSNLYKSLIEKAIKL